MRFGEWRRWMRTLPWSLRWFVILVLVRPLIDMTFALKDVSPVLSPLNLVGLLTPLLIILSYCSKGFPQVRRTAPDFAMGALTAIVVLNIAVVFFEDPSFDGFGFGLKLVLPSMLYFYVRHLVQTKRDLLGILTTILYAACLPICMLVFERVVTPVGGLVQTRGGVRYEGLYADVLSYATFIMGAWIVGSFLILDTDARLFRSGRTWKLIALIGVWLLGLSSMHHATSWMTAGVLTAIFLFHYLSARELPILATLVVVGMLAFRTFGGDLSQRVGGMYMTDMAVLRGEKDTRFLFHGRMGRWTRHLETWQENSPGAKALGIVMDGAGERSGRVLGMHNDYLRILFSSGILGLCAYVLFYLQVFLGSLYLARAERCLVWSAAALVLLYSVTNIPTMFPGMMYLCLPVLAYGGGGARAVVRAGSRSSEVRALGRRIAAA